MFLAIATLSILNLSDKICLSIPLYTSSNVNPFILSNFEIFDGSFFLLHERQITCKFFLLLFLRLLSAWSMTIDDSGFSLEHFSQMSLPPFLDLFSLMSSALEVNYLCPVVFRSVSFIQINSPISF